jgi:CHY zinc finger
VAVPPHKKPKKTDCQTMSRRSTVNNQNESFPLGMVDDEDAALAGDDDGSEGLSEMDSELDDDAEMMYDEEDDDEDEEDEHHQLRQRRRLMDHQEHTSSMNRTLTSSSSSAPAESSSTPSTSANAPAAATGATNSAPSSNEPPPEPDAQLARRRAIQAIMRDTTLSQQEKNMRIQNIMSGGRTSVTPAPAPTLLPPIPAEHPTAAQLQQEGALAVVPTAACVHYERNCYIVAPCCEKVFGCRICHDEFSPQGHPIPMDRYAIREIICKNCHTKQPCS